MNQDNTENWAIEKNVLFVSGFKRWECESPKWLLEAEDIEDIWEEG
jgi:hypothetical protein